MESPCINNEYTDINYKSSCNGQDDPVALSSIECGMCLGKTCYDETTVQNLIRNIDHGEDSIKDPMSRHKHKISDVYHVLEQSPCSEPIPLNILVPNDSDSDSDSDSDDEELIEVVSGDPNQQDFVYLRINGELVEYEDITDSHIENMTPEERESYDELRDIME